MGMKEILLLLVGLPCCLTGMVYTFWWVVGNIEPIGFSSWSSFRKYRATRNIASASVTYQQGRIVPIGYTNSYNGAVFLHTKTGHVSVVAWSYEKNPHSGVQSPGRART
jgi:hypothetical protein